jgi:2'-5' RNA ligase
MDTERWRCFVAIPLGEELRSRLAGAVDGWRVRADLDGLRWTDPASWHVTLAFVGPVEATTVSDLAARLADVVGHHAPMQFRTGRVGGFPSPARARVAWHGVADPNGALAHLARDVRRATAVEGSAFRGHITLARARRDPVDLRTWLREADAPDGQLAVDRVELMRSHLGRGPARYEVLDSLALGVGARV